MARLNEPAVSTDSIETLRRKFLRQNRDIARINSTQSLKIRALENECSRLLSENLDLRGQILRLEKELDDSSAQRIADHALDIKAKLEAQLLEWGSLLAGLGLEPPMKKRSPHARRTKARSSLARSTPQRRPRHSKENEALALDEGRLPPIQEHKSYPRITMDRNEILALCSEAASTADSPDLGPPPVSRFVEEDPVKVDSPSTAGYEAGQPTPSAAALSLANTPVIPLKLDPVKKCMGETETESQFRAAEAPTAANMAIKPTNSLTQDVESEAAEETGGNGGADESKAQTSKAGDQPGTNQSLKAGSKRKFGTNDEEAKARSVRSLADRTRPPRAGQEKGQTMEDKPVHRAVKEPVSLKRDKNGAAPSGLRKPLAAKTTNEDLTSPRKTVKASSLDEITAAKTEAAKEVPTKDPSKPRKKEPAVVIKVPQAAAPPVVDISPEPTTPSSHAPASLLPSPLAPSIREESRDTPPPTHISCSGETSRPGRRSRAAVSYAEPNLRDKMRRPSKQLFDAVAGEGKYAKRTAHPKSSDLALVAATTGHIKIEDETPDVWKRLPMAQALPLAEDTRESVPSPLGREEPSPEELPNTVITNRRKRMSSIGTRDSSIGLSEASDAESTSSSIIAQEDNKTDPYEFTSTSPVSEAKESPDGGQGRGTSRSSRSSRRSTTALRDCVGQSDSHAARKPSRSSSQRKRASMAVTKRASVTDVNEMDESDSGLAPDGVDDAPSSRKDRVSRRRSMML